MKGKKILMIGLFGLAYSLAAQADYLTGAYVDTDLEVDAPYNEILDDSANGFMVGYGWETPHKWLSLEVTYTEFGDSDKAISESYETKYYKVTETLQGEYEGKAIDLWLVGRFSPFSITKDRPVNIVPRIGLTAAQSFATLQYNVRLESEESVQTGGYRVSADDTGVGYAYGIGLEVGNVIPNVDVFVDYRKHEVEMVFAGEKLDFDPATIQVGINYHF